MNAAKREYPAEVQTTYGPALLYGIDPDKKLANVGYKPAECTNDEIKAFYWRGGNYFIGMIDLEAVIT